MTLTGHRPTVPQLKLCGTGETPTVPVGRHETDRTVNTLATRYEYRITYRRADWSEVTADQSRVFQTRHAAGRFVDKLQGYDRPDLAPIIRTRLSRRRVEPWMEGWS